MAKKTNPVRPELISALAIERFWSRVQKAGADDCWLWTGSVRPNGYGCIKTSTGTNVPHRVAWALTHGEIPDGMTLDHRCEVKTCCNPAHLEPMTQSQNIKLYFERHKDDWTRCKCGAPRGKRFRNCPPCHAAYQRDYRQRRYEVVRNAELKSQAKRKAEW